MNKVNGNRFKFITLFITANLFIMLFFAITYKFQNPSIVFEVQQSKFFEHDEKEQIKDMITKLMKRLKENPNDIEALKGLGFIFTEMRAWDNARVFLEKAINLKPDDRDVIVKLATCYLYLERYEDGARLLEKFVKMEPENYIAKFNLAYLYGFILNKKQRARQLFIELKQQKDLPANIMEKVKESLDKLEQ